MSDLERALLAGYRDAWEALLPNGPSHQVMFAIKITPLVDAALAAARREGAEAERARHEGASEIIQRAAKLIKTGEGRHTALTDAIEAAERRGAEEMRERAARVCDLDDFVVIKASALAADIRALPLTPEERE